MSYLGERGVLCVGNGWHLCTPVLMNMSNITFQGLRLSTLVFNKCSEIILFTIIFVVKSSKGFGWNNVGPASQTVAQHYISIGSMYRVIVFFSGAGILKITSIMQQSEKTVQSPKAVSMTGQRQRLWVNIETVLECPCLRRRRLISIEAAMGCNAGTTLNRNLVGGPSSSVFSTT